MLIDTKKRLEIRNRPEEISIMHQNWKHLLFLHWEYDREEIQKSLPPGLFVDTFEGKAFISIVPFFLEDLSIGKLPCLPGLSNFIEVNVRTYVYDEQGIPGIWFYSLDINSFIASKVAYLIFSLPYFSANLKQIKSNEEIIIEGFRKEKPQAEMKFSYTPLDNSSNLAEPETLDFFLIERYVLFSWRSNQLNYLQVHHNPYPLTSVVLNDCKNNLLEANGFAISKNADVVHYSSEVNVEIFRMKKLPH